MRLWKDAAEAVYITNMMMILTTDVYARIRMGMANTPCTRTIAVAGRGRMKCRKEIQEGENGSCERIIVPGEGKTYREFGVNNTEIKRHPKVPVRCMLYASLKSKNDMCVILPGYF